jgi:hypothetical protein
MKDWCKIIETETYDVLVQRKSDDDTELILITIQTDDAEITQTLGFDNVKKANKVYAEKIDKKYCIDFIEQFKNIKEFMNHKEPSNE